MQILTKNFIIKKILFIFGLACIVMMCGCERNQKNRSKMKNKMDYIAFTLTYSDSEKEKQKEKTQEYNEDSLKKAVSILDLATKEVRCIATLPYTSQYPLTCYSEDKNQIFYTANAPDNHGDEVFAYDTISEKSRQITDNYFAINYIYPLENELFIGAVLRGNHDVVQPFLYNETKNEVYDLTQDEDFFIAAAAMNKDKKIYVAGYSENKSEELLQKNKDEGLTNYIYEYDANSGKWEKILKKEKCYIETLAVDDPTLIYRWANKEFDAEKYIYKLDLLTGNEEKINVDKYTVNSMGDFLGFDGENLYFTEKCYDDASVDSYSKLWKIDLNTCKKELLYETELGANINNGFLVKK